MSAAGAEAVSAVVVTHDSAACVAECLRSLEAARHEVAGRLEIILVDNRSTDATVDLVREQFPGARVIVTHRNLGFGAAANIGLAEANGQTLLLLNPDATLTPGALGALHARLARSSQIGCVGPVYVRPDGGCESPGRSFPSIGVAIADGTMLERWLRRSAVLRRYYRDGASLTSPPDWMHGACLCFRREAIQAIGGFDAGYFMYAEELDLLRDLRVAGWTCAIEPAARVHHVGGASADLDPVARERNFFRSRYRLASKLWGRRFAVFQRLFVALTDLVRLVEEALKLPLWPDREARLVSLRRIARVALWQWLGWRR